MTKHTMHTKATATPAPSIPQDSYYTTTFKNPVSVLGIKIKNCSDNYSRFVDFSAGILFPVNPDNSINFTENQFHKTMEIIALELKAFVQAGYPYNSKPIQQNDFNIENNITPKGDSHMENTPQVFKFDTDKLVRTIVINNEPHFVAKDVAEALEYTWAGIATIKHVPDIWRGVNSVQTPSGIQEMLCLTEQGLFFFANRSDKPKALPFQMWLAGEVLPSIRKHGFYGTDNFVENALNDPDTFITVLQKFKEEKAAKLAAQQKVMQLNQKIEVDAPKVLFADSVTTSHSEILIGDLAKLLKQNGYNIGQNRLFDWLRENGYLMKGGSSKNMPTQKSMEQGLFRVKETTINNPDGSIRITKTTKVTGKGQVYFVNKFLTEKKAA